jgi:hypothetical protein
MRRTPRRRVFHRRNRSEGSQWRSAGMFAQDGAPNIQR